MLVLVEPARVRVKKVLIWPLLGERDEMGRNLYQEDSSVCTPGCQRWLMPCVLNAEAWRAGSRLSSCAANCLKLAATCLSKWTRGVFEAKVWIWRSLLPPPAEQWSSQLQRCNRPLSSTISAQELLSLLSHYIWHCRLQQRVQQAFMQISDLFWVCSESKVRPLRTNEVRSIPQLGIPPVLWRRFGRRNKEMKYPVSLWSFLLKLGVLWKSHTLLKPISNRLEKPILFWSIFMHPLRNYFSIICESEMNSRHDHLSYP